MRFRRLPSPLLIGCLAIALLAGLPVASLAVNLLLGGSGDTWSHLAATVLPDYAMNSLWLCLGVGVGVVVLGVSTAWMTSMHEFPGRRFLEWSLILPLAVPAYVMAYVYTDLFQFVGPVQTWLRESFGWRRGDYWFPEIRSLGGAIAVFSLVLFPYVYLLARTAFLERSGSLLDAARTMGYGPWRLFFSVSLPLARPAVAAGVALVLMETLADYGAVTYFAVDTFTTGIYRAWFSLGDRLASTQLAATLLGFVLLLLALERWSRGRARFFGKAGRVPARRPLGGALAAAAVIVCALPLIGGFLLPAAVLVQMAASEGGWQLGTKFFALSRNSFLLAGATALIAVLTALMLGYANRLSKGWLASVANRMASVGYAVPGAVIAVGILIPVTRVDHWLASLWASWSGEHPGLLLTGGVAALIYAYLVRFLAVALQTVDAGLNKITPSMDDAARSLGLKQGQILGRVHVPLLRSSLLAAGLLVFVDVMKELPATLVMRPFNFDTLATQTFVLASDERLSEASVSALTIVLVGLLPLIVLSRQIARVGR